MACLVSLPSPNTHSVVFPPPPPTTNSLTPGQHAQLRKSAKKLGQILGATPQLLDTDIVSILGPVHIQLPPRNEAPSPVLSESSVEDSYYSRSSSSCSLYPIHPYAAACSTPERKPLASPKSLQTSFRFKSSSTRVTNGLERPDTPVPGVLRLTVTPPSPTYSSESSSSTPSTPSQTSTKFSFFNFHSRSNSLDDVTTTSSTTSSLSDMKFTLRSTRDSSSIKPDGFISEQSFTEPSPSSVRRKKMDRLRKVLGDEVPVHLVFPDQKGVHTESAKGSEAEEQASSGFTSVAVAGTVIPRAKKSYTSKIITARDSMGVVTPHRAKRQEKQKMDRSMSPTPSPPIVTPSSNNPNHPSQKQLGVIIESPDEHGTSSFEAFGFGGSTMKKSSFLVQTSWPFRDGTNTTSSGKEEANKVWSTRKGYTGWDRSMTFGKSERERKRTMSYRKPPPTY